MATRIQLRRDLAQNWNSIKPVLYQGEIGIETDTNRFKIGDGLTAWDYLDYYITPINGTYNQITVTETDHTQVLSLPSILVIPGTLEVTGAAKFDSTVLLHANPTLDLQAATKLYVDNQIGNVNTSLGGYIQISSIDQAGGVPSLDGDGYVPDSEINPDIARVSYVDTSVSTANSHAEFVAGTAQTNAQTFATNRIGDSSVNGTTGNTITNRIATAKSQAITSAEGYTDNLIGDNSVNGTSGNTVKDRILSAKSDAETYTDNQITNLINGAPATLDTLAEIATALGSDANLSTTLTNSIALKAPLASPTFTGTVSGITKSMVGLGNVDNTADSAKPVSTAQSAAIATAKSEAITAAGSAADTKVSTAVAALTKSSVGLANVDNTSDANKPVSSATQTALDAKLASSTAASTYAPIASPTFTGTVSGVTKAHVGLGNVDNTADTAKPVSTATQTALDLKAPLASPTFTGTVSGITKSMVGLGSVDNTADTAKPISTATQTALDAKAPLASPTFTGTVSGITKSMVGLGNVDNTTDASKPISTATQTALDLKLASATAATTYETISNVALKAPLASPTFTGTVTLPTGTVTSAMILDETIVDADINASAAIAQSKISGLSTSLGLKADLASPTFTGTVNAAAVSTSGNVIIGGNLTVNGTTTTINSTTVSTTDSNIEIAKVGTPTDVTANGAGITVKGATDKTINWYSSTGSFTISENVDIASGKTYKINGTDVLTATAVGGRTIPASNIVGLTDTQTLTNKTLTSPVIATISNTGTLTLPTSTDTLVGRATTDTLTNKSISGSTNTLSNIGNSSLTNSSITVNGTAVSLGGSVSGLATNASPTFTGTVTLPLTTGGYVTTNSSGVISSVATIPNSGLTNSTISGVSLGSNLNALTIGTGLSGTSYNGSGAVTIANTGVLSVNGSTGAVTGIATTASPTFTGTVTLPLTTSGYVTTSGSGVISSVSTIPNSGLTNSSLTVGSTNIALGATATTLAGLTSVTSTGFTGALTGNVTGNASTATTLATPRNINGVAFDGSAAITITAVNPNALTIGTGLSGTSYTGSGAVTIAIDSTVATLTGSQTFTNKTLSSPSIGSATLTGSLTANASTGTNGQYLQSTGTGVQWSNVPAGYNAPTIGSTSIASGATVTSISGLSLANAGTISTTGDVTIGGNLTVSGTTTTVNSTTLAVADSNIEIAKVGTPTDVTANGGGITIKGATDKTFNWYSSTAALTSSENMDLASGKTYKIAGTTVLSGSQIFGKSIGGTSSGDIVSIDGTQTLTNKTLTSPVINSATSNNLTLTGSVTAGGVTGTSGYLLTSTGTGVQWAAAPVSLPSQTGNSGKILTTDGSAASWITQPYSVIAANGTAKTVRNTLNFIGATLTDDSVNNATNVTISGGSPTGTLAIMLVEKITGMTIL